MDHSNKCGDTAHNEIWRSGGNKTLGVLLFDEPSGQLSCNEARVHYQSRQERDIALNPLDLESIQCATHGGSGAVAIRPVGNQLSNHWVIVHADLTAFTDPGIYPHSCRLDWGAKTQQTPGRGYEPPERVLCINPGFDGPAADAHIILGQSQRLTGGNT